MARSTEDAKNQEDERLFLSATGVTVRHVVAMLGGASGMLAICHSIGMLSIISRNAAGSRALKIALDAPIHIGLVMQVTAGLLRQEAGRQGWREKT